MKEILAIIRINMVNKTKEALAKEGFPSITCRKVLGRGKRKVDYELIGELLEGRELPMNSAGESVSEGHRLISKRLFFMTVKDDEVKKVVDTIISVNKTGNPGDGKVFVLPVDEVVRVRTGEKDEVAL